ncbi:MAG TPA: hypothetical protein VHC49_09795, partial [Mycobacteriales bacterium]|nr:hypothetical protein [Mycobacteriales bacterium]
MIVGRDADLAAIATRLAAPGLIVLTGPPGIGRTALALAAAERTGRPIAAGGGLSLLRDTAYLPLVR